MSESSSESSSDSEIDMSAMIDPILTPPPDPVPEPAPLSTPHPSSSVLQGFESIPEVDPWTTMPLHPPKLVKSSPTISADSISLTPHPSAATADSSFITVPNSSSSAEVIYILETIDDEDIVIHHDVINKNTSQNAFYKDVNTTINKLWEDNDHLKLVHGFIVYKVETLAYYTKLSRFNYNTFWTSKLAKDKLIISNHIFGNKPIYLTFDMKDALKK